MNVQPPDVPAAGRGKVLAYVIVACLLVYPVYLVLLVAMDTAWGAQSFLSELWFGSKRRIVLDILSLGLRSVWLVLPMTAAAALLVAAGPGPDGFAGLGGRVLLVMVAVGVGIAMLLPLTPLQSALLAVTLGVALLLPLTVFRRFRRASL